MAKFECPVQKPNGYCSGSKGSKVGGTEEWVTTGGGYQSGILGGPLPTTRERRVVGGTEIYHRTVTTVQKNGSGEITSSKQVLFIETKNTDGDWEWRPAATKNIGPDGKPIPNEDGNVWSYSDPDYPEMATGNADGKGGPIAGESLQKSLNTNNSQINNNVRSQEVLSTMYNRDIVPPNQARNVAEGNKNAGVVTGVLTGKEEEDLESGAIEEQETAAETAAAAAETAADLEERKKEAEATAKSEMNVGEDKERTDYGGQIVRYPITLDGDTQDFMLFDMLKYQPRNYDTGADSMTGIKSRANMGLQSGRAFKGATPAGTQDGERKIIATIGLPIPAGISDSNGVDWGQAQSDQITTALAGIFGDFIPKGSVNTEATEGATSEGTQMAIQNAIMNNALSGADFSKRKWGMAANTNMELLFNGPKLRSFTFTFRLSARSNDEATAIKKIIRTFKQGMSPKKSKSFTFVKAPHTFMIGYYHKTNTHQWLNTFKEAALTNLALTYTPDGQYSTFTDGPMTAYQMQLQFQELEPVFDGDYNDLDGNADTHIGY